MMAVGIQKILCLVMWRWWSQNYVLAYIFALRSVRVGVILPKIEQKIARASTVAVSIVVAGRVLFFRQMGGGGVNSPNLRTWRYDKGAKMHLFLCLFSVELDRILVAPTFTTQALQHAYQKFSNKET